MSQYVEGTRVSGSADQSNLTPPGDRHAQWGAGGVLPVPPRPDEPKKKRSRGWILVVCLAIVSFFGGLISGTGSNETRATELQSTNTTLVDEVEALTTEVDELTGERDVAVAELDVVVAENTELTGGVDARSIELDERTIQLDTRTVELDERTTALDTRETELDARETELTTLSGELDSRETAVEAAENDVSSQSTSTSNGSSDTSVYYENCAAARAAGADPVRVGDPGYGSHLDRDGDGVGCE